MRRFPIAWRRKRSCLALRRKSILAPIFTADAVMDEEQALRIILALDFQQPRIIRSPESSLPINLEIITLGNVRARARSDLGKLLHSLCCVSSGITRAYQIGRRARHTRVSRRPGAPDDHQRKRIENLRIGSRRSSRGGVF